jgi:hypothetical protein
MMLLFAINITQCAHSIQHLLTAVLLVKESAISCLSVISCHFLEKQLFKRASWNLYFLNTGCCDCMKQSI